MSKALTIVFVYKHSPEYYIIMGVIIENLEMVVEFAQAFGSLVGWFIVVLGVLGILFGSKRMRTKCLWYIIMAGILIIVCGPTTGFQYFFIY